MSLMGVVMLVGIAVSNSILIVEFTRHLRSEVHGDARLELGGARCARRRRHEAAAAALLGRPYSISGHVVHGAKLGRALGESGARPRRRLSHPEPALRPPEAGGDGHLRRARARPRRARRSTASPASACGRRVDDSGRVLLEVHCLDWPAALGAEGGYGKLVRVELLHKLRDEARYDSLDALTRRDRPRRRRCARLPRRRSRGHAATGGRRRATEFDAVAERRSPARPRERSVPASRRVALPAAR